jgi:hypothetical protein
MARMETMALTYEYDTATIVQSTRELFLDFEQELAELLRRPQDDSSSTSSSSSTSLYEGDLGVRRRSSTTEVDFENDGTISCSAITFDVLVNEFCLEMKYAS